ncbi:ABC transporter permease [Clostridium thermarum]|uniref:ABC transporter permease n=1 Tax=Clostridium thermarum TaxID=1716543 RepID=UPI0013D51A30|nr:ABC transporter permease [Clostridium thermarum]
MLLNIMLKEIKQNFRDVKGTILMTLFPFVLMIILGTAFSGVFGEGETTKIKAKVLYKNEARQAVAEGFKQLVETLKENGMTFEENLDETSALDSIKAGKYSCYVVLKDDEIIIYKNEKLDLEANIVESVFKAFIDKFNLMSEIVKYKPEAAKYVLSSEGVNAVERTTLDKKKSPRAIDYYAVTMVSLIIMYSSMAGMYSILSEKTRKTENRLLIAPISKNKLLIGKMLGTIVSTILQLTMVIIASKFILKANWGEDILTVAIILITEAMAFISLGVAVALLFKRESAANGILNTVIPAFAFLGGGYMNIEDIGSEALLKIANISPIRWVNIAILNIIYNNDYSGVSTTLAINVTSIIIIIILCVLLFRKEEA